MPIFAKDIFNGDAKTFSWFESAAGVGSVISAVYLANLKTSKNLVKIIIAAGLVFGVSVLMVAYAGRLPFALIFMSFTGLGMMAQTSAINTYIQTHAIPAMRARAISYYVMAYQGMIPVGSLMVGWLANELGPRMAVGIEGAIGLLATGVFILYKKRQYTETLMMRKAAFTSRVN